MCDKQTKKSALPILAALMLALAILACGRSDSPDSEIEQETTLPPGPTVDISDCTLGALYQDDVTIPDNTQIELGESFVKTWRIRNTGTCDWGEGYRFAFVEGEQMGTTDAVKVPETPAGETAEISVELVAPREAGQYRAYWQMCVNESNCFGDKLYVQIVAFDPDEE